MKQSEGAGNRHSQHNVEARGAGKTDGAEAGQPDERAPSADAAPACSLSVVNFLSVDSPADPVHKHRGQQAAKSRSEPGCIFVYTEDPVAQHHHPVKQWRLFEPGQSSQCRRNQISAREHFAGDLGVTRLIRSDEWQRTEIPKIESCNGDKEKKPGALGEYRRLQV